MTHFKGMFFSAAFKQRLLPFPQHSTALHSVASWGGDTLCRGSMSRVRSVELVAWHVSSDSRRGGAEFWHELAFYGVVMAWRVWKCCNITVDDRRRVQRTTADKLESEREQGLYRLSDYKSTSTHLLAWTRRDVNVLSFCSFESFASG